MGAQRHLVAAVAVALLAACGNGSGGGNGVTLGELRDGIITYYDATGAGACSFPATPNDLDVAALNAEEWAGSALCGGCVRVDGPRGSVTVRIVDLCPECKRGHLDLSREAFAKVANPADGRVAVKWQLVSCNVTGPVAYHFKDGSSRWWTAIQVRNHRLPIERLEIDTGSGFTSVARESYNYFVDTNGAGPAPFRVRITAQGGAQLLDQLPAPRSDTLVSGAAQL